MTPNLSCLLSIYATVGSHLLSVSLTACPSWLRPEKTDVFTVCRMMQVVNETRIQKRSAGATTVQFGSLVFVPVGLPPSQAFISPAPESTTHAHLPNRRESIGRKHQRSLGVSAEAAIKSDPNQIGTAISPRNFVRWLKLPRTHTHTHP